VLGFRKFHLLFTFIASLLLLFFLFIAFLILYRYYIAARKGIVKDHSPIGMLLNADAHMTYNNPSMKNKSDPAIPVKRGITRLGGQRLFVVSFWTS